MKITIIGTGYVGLVTGACFADMGNDVICYDKDTSKISKLNNNEPTIYEPGLTKLIKQNLEKNTIQFSNNAKVSIEHAEVIFIAVGTPMNEDGSTNLTNIYNVAKDIGHNINSYKLIVNKSTAPVGTVEEIGNIISKINKNINFDIASNPEFLKEGKAINDFMSPDRIIIGLSSDKASKILKTLYQPFITKFPRIIEMDIKSAEMTKYAANAMLATKISFINEIAMISEKIGADINKIRLGIGSDCRIGYDFIYPGIGYGGSCFPKDVKSLSLLSKKINNKPLIIQAANSVNSIIQQSFIDRIIKKLKEKKHNNKIAIWGLSFKPETDDIREAPSIKVIDKLLENGYEITSYDPKGMENAKQYFGDKIKYSTDKYDALIKSYALVLLTEWKEFRSPDFSKISKNMDNKLIFDGRNQFDSSYMESLGFEYHQIGVKSR